MRMMTLRPGTRSCPDPERGSITVFAVLMTTTFIAVAGLLTDGGLALAGKVAAITQAQDAARTAETAINQADLRRGHVSLAPAQAFAAARRYLAAAGDTGTVLISGTQVHVVAHRTVRTQVLRLFGIDSITETGDATAVLEPGISRPFDLTPPPAGAAGR